MLNLENRASRKLFNLVLFFSFFTCVFNTYSQQVTLSKQEYYDKTLAMLIGTCGGVITGYEYLKVYNTPNGFYQPGATVKQPVEFLLGLPDDWFILLNGTLGGTTKDEYNYFSNYQPGIIYSDDDQHVEVFNQHILEQYGPSVAFEDIKKEWITHDLRDFGGTADALGLINSKNLIAPLMGQREHGNYGHWLPECYIEHEMVGANFPGMPNKAAEYVAKFASMSGQGENLLWGQYWAAAHAIAYFETDARVVVEKALGVLPQNCYAREMYDIAVSLHQKYPNDWRAAVRELWNDHRRGVYAVGSDKVHLQPEVNHGLGLLAVFYGENDYMETLKICSLAGGDGDCTAANLCGMMGIIKGMSGTPQAFVDNIYANGNGKWINDLNHALHMNKDFPVEHKFTDLTSLFQRNMERMLWAYGGTVTGGNYTVNRETANLPSIATQNWDFEMGDFTNWNVWGSAGNGNAVFVERQCNNGTKACFAATGEYKGTVITGSDQDDAKLYQTVTGLTPGGTYKVEARMNSTAGRQARFYADNYGGPYIYTSIYNHLSDFPYRYLYVTLSPNSTSMDVGMHTPPTTNPGKWANLDDIVITQVPTLPSSSYEAENAVLNAVRLYNSSSASGGSYVGGIDSNTSSIEFQNVSASYSGEHMVRIFYANATTSMGLHQLQVNGVSLGNVEYPDSGPWGQFSQNFIEAPVRLNEGSNTIKLTRVANYAEIDKIEVLAAFDGNKPADDSGILTGGVYKIINRNSNKSLDLGSSGQNNGDNLLQWDYFGSNNQKFRLEEVSHGVYAIYPLHSNKSLDVLGVSMANGATVVQWDYLGGGNQQWAVVSTGDGFFKLINNNSGKVMEVADASGQNGADVRQWQYTGGAHQQWKLEKLADPAPNQVVSGGVYRMINKMSSKSLDIDAMSQNNLAQLIQWEYLGNLNQQYKVELTNGGFYRITPMHSGKALEIENSLTTNGAFVKQFDYWGGHNQQWSIIPESNGYYKIINRHSGKVMDVLGLNTNNGAKVGQWDFVGGDSQLWRFERDFSKPSGFAREESPESELDSQFNVFPNPTEGKLTVQLPKLQSQINVKLLTIDGKELLNKDYENTQQIELETSSLGHQGMILLKISSGDYSRCEKILLK